MAGRRIPRRTRRSDLGADRFQNPNERGERLVVDHVVVEPGDLERRLGEPARRQQFARVLDRNHGVRRRMDDPGRAFQFRDAATASMRVRDQDQAPPPVSRFIATAPPRLLPTTTSGLPAS